MAERLDPRTAAAAVRAAGALPARYVDQALVDRFLAPSGRQLVSCISRGERHLTVRWHDQTAPVIDQDKVVAPVATRAFALTFAAVLGCCWTQPDDDPYPGEPVTVDEVIAAASGQVSYTWAKGALDHSLSAAGLVELDRDTVRLGYAVAAFTAGQISALRRLYDQLPRPADSTAEET